MEEIALFPFLESETDTRDSNIVTKIIPKGTKIFEAGDNCGGVPFVLRGVIRVSKIGKNGREIILYRLKSGDACILTIASVLSNGAFPATAIVEEEATVVLLSIQQFKMLMAENTEVQKYVYKLLSDRFLDVMTLMDEIIFRKIDERLIEFLLVNSQKNGDILEITHDELATELGTVREVISRVIKGLEREDCIRLSRGKVKIKNRNILEQKLSEF